MLRFLNKINLKINQIKFFKLQKILSSQTQITKGLAYIVLKDFFKSGLLISDGQNWLKRRRILTPAFHFNILNSFFEIFKNQCQNLIKTLGMGATKTEGTNLNTVAALFTLNTICGILICSKILRLFKPESFRNGNGSSTGKQHRNEEI